MASLHDRHRRGDRDSIRHRDSVRHPRHAGPLEVRSVADSAACLDMDVGSGFELKFGKKPFLLFGMMGATLFAIGAVAGLVD